MKLLVITPAHLEGHKIGGPIASTKAMLQGIAEQGVAIDVLSTPMGVEDESAVMLNKWLPTDFPLGRVMYFRYFGYRHFTFSPGLAAAVWRLAPEYDLVILNGTWNFPILVGGWAALRWKMPYVIWPHGTLYKYTIEARSRRIKWLVYRLALRRIILRADAVHFTTEHEVAGFQAHFGFLPHYFLQPNGFRIEAFAQLPPRGGLTTRFPELAGKRQVLFFGRITRKKGLDLLVEAFRTIAAEFPETQLVVAGPVDDEGLYQELQTRIRAWGLQARVTFTGLLTADQRFTPLVDAEMFVLPSFSENFGMAVIEAMLCGLPVIVSTEVGVAEGIKKHDAGLVIPPTAEATTAALRRMLTDPELRARCIAAGRAYARDSFSHLKIGERLVKYYERIVANS